MSTLFISDLHLDPSRPHITGLFLTFLRRQAVEAESLYVLGDLFEAWIGDDDDGELADVVRNGLARLSGQGAKVLLMRGNRDFLLGTRFAADTGATLLPDPCVVSLHGQPTLLMHGDLLCTDDLEYLAFREQVRAPGWQETFLAQPLAERRAFAGKARDASGQRQRTLQREGQLEAVTDVNPAAVEKTMARYGVTRLIHGHTHRPAIHSLRLAQGSAQRVVLGDWYEQGSALRVSPDGLELTSLALDET